MPNTLATFEEIAEAETTEMLRALAHHYMARCALHELKKQLALRDKNDGKRTSTFEQATVLGTPAQA